MNVRVTLTHSVLGSLEISPPDGWKEAKFRLERHNDFHSLIEFFNGSFIFYGNNGVENGGIDFIIQVLETYGYDAELEILIEISFDDTTYPLSFSGLLDLENKEHMPKNKMLVPIIRNDFWSKFISRFDTPVDLKSVTDLDDNAVTPTESITGKMNSQVIVYSADYRGNESFTYPVSGSTLEAFITLAWYNELITDISINGSYLKENNFSSIAPTFYAPWDGNYRIQLKFALSVYDPMPSSWILPDSSTHFYIIRSGTSAQQITRNTVNIFGTPTAYEYVYDETIFLNSGEAITVYGEDDDLLDQPLTILGEARYVYGAGAMAATTGPITLSGAQTIDGYSAVATDRILVKDQNDKSENGLYTVSAGAWSRTTGYDTTSIFNLLAIYVFNGTINGDTHWKQTQLDVEVGVDPIIWEFLLPSSERFLPYTGHDVSNYIKITAETVYKDTNAEGFFLHDVASGIINRTVGTNSFYSEYLGSDQTLERQYDEDGCAWKYMLLKGLQIRQYSLDDKPFFQSFKQWWEGINPILNLGLGYEEIDGEKVIRVEEKEHFYDDSSSLVNFSNVELIGRYDQEYIFKKIEIGYKKWQAEDVSGIDDPQTKKTYASRLRRSGKDLKIESEFIAASLAIETTRRKTREKSEDYKFDNDVFIVAIDPNGPDTSPETLTYQPELDENFDSVTNLNNSDTRYNLRLTPARSMLRWLNVINGALQKYLTSSYKFTSGEGNYDATTEMSASDCDANFDGDSLSEKQDIPVTADFLFFPESFECVVDMTYEEYLLIRDNKKRSIGISQTDTGHVLFRIKELEYEPFNSRATVTVWPKDPFSIIVPADEFVNRCVSASEGDILSNWILAGGIWNDNGEWIDTENWIDSI